MACKIGNMGKWPVKMSHCGVPGRRFYTQTLLHTDAFTHIAILLQFLAIQPHFVRKGRAGQVEIAILPQFLPIEPHFVRKGCAGQVEIVILPQFLTIEPHFVRKGPPETRNRNFTSVFGDRTSFRAKGLRRTT